jgi:hypothetical protein
VDAIPQALLDTNKETSPVMLQPYNVSKDIQILKLGKACGFDDIPNQCLRHLPEDLFFI